MNPLKHIENALVSTNNLFLPNRLDRISPK